jgi:hypothetical protein
MLCCSSPLGKGEPGSTGADYTTSLTIMTALRVTQAAVLPWCGAGLYRVQGKGQVDLVDSAGGLTGLVPAALPCSEPATIRD